MAFFRTINFSEPPPSIGGDGVMLRTPQMADFPEWAALREASRDFLTPWEPTWPTDDSDPKRIPSPYPALRRGHPHRPGLRVS